MKCSCGNTATGTLLTYYHDGYGILACMPMCDDCGSDRHNPVTTWSRCDDAYAELRPRLFVRTIVSKDFRVFTEYRYLDEFLSSQNIT